MVEERHTLLDAATGVCAHGNASPRGIQLDPVAFFDAQALSILQRNICRRLTGEDIPVEDYMKHEGIFEKISGFFRRGQEGAR